MSIATELTKLQSRRDSIVSAISDKGGTIASGASLAECATAIASIPSGGGSLTKIEGEVTFASKSVGFAITDSRIDFSKFVCFQFYCTELQTTPQAGCIEGGFVLCKSLKDSNMGTYDAFDGCVICATSSSGTTLGSSAAYYNYKSSDNSITVRPTATRYVIPDVTYNWIAYVL